jgi:predicted O-methyltransferase YrrM
MVTVVEGDAHEQVAKQKAPIDVAFIDADKAGYAVGKEQLAEEIGARAISRFTPT